MRCSSINHPRNFLLSVLKSHQVEYLKNRFTIHNTNWTDMYLPSPILLHLSWENSLFSSRWTWPWIKTPWDVQKPFCLSHHWLKPHDSSTFHSEHLCPHVCCAVCVVTQSWLTLCDAMDCSPSGSSVHGILQARILEWIAMPSSRDLPNPGMEPRFPKLQKDSLPFEPGFLTKVAFFGSLSILVSFWQLVTGKKISIFILKQLFLLRCLEKSVSRSVVSDSLWPHGLYLARLLCPWGSPGKNTGVCCHALLQGIFPTQGLIPGLQHCRQILYHLSYQGKPQSKWKCELLSLVKERANLIFLSMFWTSSISYVKWTHFIFLLRALFPQLFCLAWSQLL